MADVEPAGRASLTLDEKASLTAGSDMMSTAAVERLGIPVSTSPTARTAPGRAGPRSVGAHPPVSRAGRPWGPRGTPACWALGALLGTEARRKACRPARPDGQPPPLAPRRPQLRVLLRGPAALRRLAAAFVRGVQPQGVATTVKHLVGNEAETERISMSSVIDERTLRELYLLPFEVAVKDGGASGS